MGHRKIWNHDETHGGGYIRRIHNMHIRQTRKKKASEETLLTWPTSTLLWTRLLRMVLSLPRQKHLPILFIKPYPASFSPLCSRKFQPRAPSPGLKPFNSWPGTQPFLGEDVDNFRYLCPLSLTGLKDLWWLRFLITLGMQSICSLQNQFKKHNEAIAEHLYELVSPDEPEWLSQYSSNHILGTLPSFHLILCTKQSWSR